MERILEPELMEEEQQGLAYAQADFSEPNRQFLHLFTEKFPDFPDTDQEHDVSVIDLGCGPADILIRFAHRFPGCRCLGIDGAEAMLAPGRAAVDLAGLAGRVDLSVRRLPCADIPAQSFQVILSNSLLHHLHHPEILWQTLATLAAPGCRVLIMDLMRPRSKEAARHIVETYSGNEPDILKTDFYHSLLAAFCVKEVRAQLKEADLARSLASSLTPSLASSLTCAQVSDRHLAVFGTL